MLSSKRGFSLRKAAFLVMTLLLLAIFFAQFAVAADGNISISGTKYLDANSNGKFDSSSEQTLKGYAIYIHKDNTGQLQQGDPVSITNETGMYSFTNISNKGFVRELVTSGDQFQPSSPKNGYDLADAKKGDILDFGNSIPKAADSAPDKSLIYIIGFVAVVIIIFGLYLLVLGLWRLKSLPEKDIKADRKIVIQLASGFVLLVLGLYLLISLAQISRNGATIAMSSSFALVTPVVLTLLVFGAVLLMLYVQNKLQEPNETGGMRKTIAGLLVIGLIVVILFALIEDISKNENIISQFIQLVGIVIAFYFGSKATSDAYSKQEEAKKSTADLEAELEKAKEEEKNAMSALTDAQTKETEAKEIYDSATLGTDEKTKAYDALKTAQEKVREAQQRLDDAKKKVKDAQDALPKKKDTIEAPAGEATSQAKSELEKALEDAQKGRDAAQEALSTAYTEKKTAQGAYDAAADKDKPAAKEKLDAANNKVNSAIEGFVAANKKVKEAQDKLKAPKKEPTEVDAAQEVLSTAYTEKKTAQGAYDAAADKDKAAAKEKLDAADKKVNGALEGLEAAKQKVPAA
jgi:hypothetical protein